MEGYFQGQVDLRAGCPERVSQQYIRDVSVELILFRALRHIRLVNTPEMKPITNSRDTQEIHYEAGCEVLQIFLDHRTKSRTSLLQDFAYYEVRCILPYYSKEPN